MRWVPVVSVAAESWSREAQALDGHRKPDFGRRRQHPRWEWAGGLQLRRRGTSDVHRVRAEDVGHGGVSVQGTVGLTEGEVVEIGKTGEGEWVSARVAHVMELAHDPGMFWIGLAFVTHDEPDEAATHE